MEGPTKKSNNHSVEYYIQLLGTPSTEYLDQHLRQLAQKNKVVITPIVKAIPADEETEKFLQDFREKYLQKYKHIDKEIRAEYTYNLVSEDNVVENILISNIGHLQTRWLGWSGALFLSITCLGGIPTFGDFQRFFCFIYF